MINITCICVCIAKFWGWIIHRYLIMIHNNRIPSCRAKYITKSRLVFNAIREISQSTKSAIKYVVTNRWFIAAYHNNNERFRFRFTVCVCVSEYSTIALLTTECCISERWSDKFFTMSHSAARLCAQTHTNAHSFAFCMIWLKFMYTKSVLAVHTHINDDNYVTVVFPMIVRTLWVC